VSSYTSRRPSTSGLANRNFNEYQQGYTPGDQKHRRLYETEPRSDLLRTGGSMAPPPPRRPKNSGGASVFEYQRPMHRPSLGQPSVAVEPMRASFAQTSSRGYGQRAASEYQMPSHTLDSSQPLREQGIGSIPSSTQRRSQSHPTDERIMPSIEDEVTIKSPRSSSVADQLRGIGRSRSSVTKSGEAVTLRNSLIGVLKLEKSGNYGWATEGTTEDSLPTN
jgi:hypothetical protein